MRREHKQVDGALLPDANELRQRLADAVREAEVLRRLLRVAEFAEQQRPRDVEDGSEVPNAS